MLTWCLVSVAYSPPAAPEGLLTPADLVFGGRAFEDGLTKLTYFVTLKYPTAVLNEVVIGSESGCTYIVPAVTPAAFPGARQYADLDIHGFRFSASTWFGQPRLITVSRPNSVPCNGCKCVAV